MEERVKQLEDTVGQLVEYINKLENSGTIPHEFEAAWRGRVFGDSKITAADLTQNVQEGGSNTYNVTTAPAGVFTIKDSNGAERNVPYYEV